MTAYTIQTRRLPAVVPLDRVRSCDSCPFSVTRAPGFSAKPYWCIHPEFESADGKGGYAESGGQKVPYYVAPMRRPPSWCPLRKGPAVVKLDEKAVAEADEGFDEEAELQKALEIQNG